MSRIKIGGGWLLKFDTAFVLNSYISTHQQALSVLRYERYRTEEKNDLREDISKNRVNQTSVIDLIIKIQL